MVSLLIKNDLMQNHLGCSQQSNTCQRRKPKNDSPLKGTMDRISKN